MATGPSKKVWVTKGNLEDPKDWLNRADSFRNLIKLVVDNLSSIEDESSHTSMTVCALTSCSTLPHITMISAELYMKGFLIAKGFSLKEVVKFSHSVVALRKKCYEISNDERFINEEVIGLIDLYGPLLTDGGGARYPDVRSIFPFDWLKSIDLLHDALEESIIAKIKEDGRAAK